MKIKGFIVLISLFFSLAAQSQDDGPYKIINLLKTYTVTQHIYNVYDPIELIDSSANGSLTLVYNANDRHLAITYVPDPNFIGADTIIVEYRDFRPPTGKIKYKSYIFNVLKSYLAARPDFYTCDINATNIVIHPLENDSTSISGLNRIELTGISAQRNVTASIQGDTAIVFDARPDYSGPAYINYSVCDTLGTCENGSITIQINPANYPLSDTIHVGTAEDVAVSVVLPSDDYSITDAPDHGTAEIDNGASVLYKPFPNYFGFDTIVLEDGNFTRSIFVEIFSQPEANQFVINDRFYTPINEEVNFNVAANDLVDKYVILTHETTMGGTLTRINNSGDYKYDPPADYQGVQSFIYKACPNGVCEYGKVLIYVGDYQPKNVDYYFTTPKNTPLSLSYNIPLDAFEFESDNDSIRFYPGLDSFHFTAPRCDTMLKGYDMLLFHTPRHFAGAVDFNLTYKILSTGETYSSQIRIDVLNEVIPCPSQCTGECVWPGDIDLDGVVSMKDLLQLGYNLGNTGAERSASYGPRSRFRAQKATDWNLKLRGSSIDLKHADTDGNGKVSAADTMAISDEYRNQHSLIPEEVYARGNFPFNLEIVEVPDSIGDWAAIEIQLGNDQYPVINIAGYSYELDYNRDVVDESSLYVDFYENKWFPRGAATLNMFKKPWDGRLESGFVRANARKASGKGGVERIRFIVEDDLGGFRGDDGFLNVPFYFSNILALTEEGEIVQLEDRTINLKFKKNQDVQTELDPNKLIVYPNPTSEIVQIHLNGRTEIKSYTLYSMEGKILREVIHPDKKHNSFETHGLENGLYLLKVETSLGPITKKLEILK
ncbi:MAG: T9SS type A sorting domain-containing protein [Bacteroidota bacterium]|nr:T9SS type A sorting domain-containing protein [Bacteroidota bacterium]